MTRPPGQGPRDLGASVRERLTQRARANAENVQLILTRYAIERLLFRLGRSPHRERFVLKGAMLFVLWARTPYRATGDLDLLGYGNPAPEHGPWQGFSSQVHTGPPPRAMAAHVDWCYCDGKEEVRRAALAAGLARDCRVVRPRARSSSPAGVRWRSGGRIAERRGFRMTTRQERSMAAEDRVPWGQLIAFGLGGVIPIALFNIVLQLVPLLGNISLGINAVWLGAILVLPRLWEALADPLVGYLSDHARTRWGRRRPFILMGGIAVALSFVAIWWVPRESSLRHYVASDAGVMWLQLAFILGTLLVFFTASAVFEIPHGALGLEMSTDHHERTRLFCAKSFLGNLFAMGTPWLIFFASLDRFSGSGGTLVDGMRYVSMIIAAVLAPMAVWWFFSLREPRLGVAREQEKSSFFEDMRATISNRSFLVLTAIIFTLAMGFNFVGSFANYITIFYLYGGDVGAASTLLGITGTVWAVTALGAVFPLNWLGRRLGKNNTLLVAILLMCVAQLSKIVCYHPGALGTIELPVGLATHFGGQPLIIEGPYLILIPTMLLSAGMLMFFTLGSSMVGDVCDEDELNTGTRSEGIYYSVFWWFIKMGTALASLVMGALLVYTSFDERQNVLVDALGGNIAIVDAAAEDWTASKSAQDERATALVAQAESMVENTGKLRSHLECRLATHPAQAEHTRTLLDHLGSVEKLAGDARRAIGADDPARLLRVAGELSQHATFLRRQSPETLFRLRLVEIGLPLALSVVSILFIFRYPLTDRRCDEMKELLKQRRGELIAMGGSRKEVLHPGN